MVITTRITLATVQFIVNTACEVVLIRGYWHWHLWHLNVPSQNIVIFAFYWPYSQNIVIFALYCP